MQNCFGLCTTYGYMLLEYKNFHTILLKTQFEEYVENNKK